MSRRISVAVIGCGAMGWNHCRVLSTMRSVSEVNAYDVERERVQEVSDAHGVTMCRSLAEALQDSNAAVIATPTTTHAEVLYECLERGLPTLVEKPVFASHLPAGYDAARLAVGLEQVRGCVGVGHIERFNPAYQELKAIVKAFTPFALTCRRLSPSTGRSKDVSVTADLMIHDLDLVRDLTGMTGMQVVGGRLGQDYRVVVAATDTPDHLLVTLEASRMHQCKVREMSVACYEGVVTADLLRRQVTVSKVASAHYTRTDGYREEGSVTSIQVRPVEPLRAELEDFVAAVLGERAPLVTLKDGLAALALQHQIEHGEDMLCA